MTARRVLEFVATEDDAGVRLDVALARAAGVSRATAVRMIDAGDVTVGDAPAAKSLKLEPRVVVRAILPSDPEPPAPEVIDVRVVYEDDALLVISKPAGLVVHPAPGHRSGTLVNALLASSAPAGGDDEDRPGIVHRLDAGTSGLMIVAKDERAHELLIEAMASRAVTRIYLALVEGDPDSDSLTIDAPVGRSPKHRKKMAVVAGGKDAVTHVRVLERHGATAYVEARPQTGRTHQIRVHLEAAGYPVAGDPVYGTDRKLARALGLERPFLHAARLSFAHPLTSAPMSFDDPLPGDLEQALARAREHATP